MPTLKGVKNQTVINKISKRISLLTQKKRVLFSLLLFFIFSIGIVYAQDAPIYSPKDIFHPATSKNGIVASQERYATEAGLQVFKEGGNAIDAAVTIGFTLAGAGPGAGGGGGGGGM